MSRCGNVVELCELHELPRQAPVGGTPTMLMGGPHDEAAQRQPVPARAPPGGRLGIQE